MTRLPEPSLSDVQRWRKLVKAARAQADKPLAFGGDLYKAAKACKRAIVPPAHLVRGGVFLRLYLLGLQFASFHPDQREARVEDLRTLADQVEAALRPGTPPAPPPAPSSPGAMAREPRKDVFG